MPNPISRVAPHANILIGNAGGRPIARHPDLAVFATEAIASWANVENFMLSLFVHLLRGAESLATDVFLSLENQSSKTAAINAAADSVLKESNDNRNLLKALLAISNTHSKARNKLVHWTWGDSPNIPDALLLVNPRATIGGLNKDEIYVYKAHDFTSIIESNDRLCGYFLTFKFILKNHSANKNNQLFDELSSEPEVREKLDRLNRQV